MSKGHTEQDKLQGRSRLTMDSSRQRCVYTTFTSQTTRLPPSPFSPSPATCTDEKYKPPMPCKGLRPVGTPPGQSSAAAADVDTSAGSSSNASQRRLTFTEDERLLRMTQVRRRALTFLASQHQRVSSFSQPARLKKQSH